MFATSTMVPSWAALAVLVTVGVFSFAVWVLLQAHADVMSRVVQLECECQRQAQHICELESLPRVDDGNPPFAQQMQHILSELERLDMQSLELKTQVKAESQAQQLLKKLSGVIGELRIQLEVSVQGSTRLQQHSDDIKDLKEQLKTRTMDQIELKRQAGIIDELKTHLGWSVERQREMTRQASILDDLKAHLSASNDMSLELISTRRTSLEEAHALLAEALKTQPHSDSACLPAAPFTRMRPPDKQADKSLSPNGFVKPRQHVSPSQRTSVTFPSPDRLMTEPTHMTPETEVNADIISLEHMNLVSELDGAESADPLTPRGSSGHIPARSCSQTLARSSSQTLARSRSQTLARSRSQTLIRSKGQTLARSRSQIPASSSGQILTRGGGQSVTTADSASPFASQLYHMPLELSKQLEGKNGGLASSSLDVSQTQNSADSGCVAPEVESDCSELGGLPICRSLSRRKSMCKQPPPIPLSDFTIHPSALEPSAAASAAARSLIGHSQHTRRKSAARYVPMHSSLSLTSRSGVVSPFALQAYPAVEDRQADSLPANKQERDTRDSKAHAERPSTKLFKALSTARGLIRPHLKK